MEVQDGKYKDVKTKRQQPFFGHKINLSLLYNMPNNNETLLE